jgi:transcriptional regulator with XRE-family HTH domain
MKDIRYQVYYNIKRLREINGDKQQTVAKMLGISQSAYSRIENGESDISLEHILKLCEFYSMKPEVFFTWNGEVSIPPPQDSDR